METGQASMLQGVLSHLEEHIVASGEASAPSSLCPLP